MGNSKYSLIISNGEELDIEDYKRQSIIKEIRDFEESKPAYYNKNNTAIFLDKNSLLINTYSKNKDITDRIMPVSILIINGHHSSKLPDKLSEIVDLLNRYGIIIENTLSTKARMAIHKYKDNLRRKYIGLSVIFLIVITLGLILILNGNSNE